MSNNCVIPGILGVVLAPAKVGAGVCYESVSVLLFLVVFFFVFCSLAFYFFPSF